MNKLSTGGSISPALVSTIKKKKKLVLKLLFIKKETYFLLNEVGILSVRKKERW